MVAKIDANKKVRVGDLLVEKGLISESQLMEALAEQKALEAEEAALQKAKDSNKTLMMIASTKDCPWCRKLERQAFVFC